ncbi:MAG: Ca-activated chloride channel family protein [Salibacteraceae bacterium]
MIASKREDHIFLTTLGFGDGNLKDTNMEQLSNKGNGNYTYIDNALEARKVFVSELGSNLMKIEKDGKVQVAFNPDIVKGYKLIGYVN